MPKEHARLKFIELAEKRVRRALKDIKLIGNLSNRSNYSYTDDDVKKIHKALTNALYELKSRFDRKGEEGDIDFKL